MNSTLASVLSALLALGLGCSNEGKTDGKSEASGEPVAHSGGGAQAPSAAKPAENTRAVNTSFYSADAEGLTLLFSDLRRATKEGDTEKAAGLTMSLLPAKDDIKRALKDDAAEALGKIVALHAQFAPPNDEAAARVFAGKPERTVVKVHPATTEQIAAEAPQAAEFPGGAVQAAKTVLRPKMTFFEVELLEPGKDMGMKYHLLFHDGNQWRMLGPVWRALR